jgi:hypothetical protein
MALEAPNLRHSLYQAAANYWNPGTTLYGQGGSGQFLAVYPSSATQVTICPNQTTLPAGILQNSPDINQAAEVCFFGICKAVAGASYSAGVRLMCATDASGRLVTWTGAGSYFHAIAIDAAAAANQIVTVMVVSPSKQAT